VFSCESFSFKCVRKGTYTIFDNFIKVKKELLGHFVGNARTFLFISKK